MKNIILYTLLIISFLPLNSFGQTSEDLIYKALNDEIQRTVSSLSLNKYNPPFYTSLSVDKFTSMNINASLGAIVYSSAYPFNKQLSVKLLIGNYEVTNENFSGGTSYSSGGNILSAPAYDDYLQLRRSFWTILDRDYKQQVDKYEQKQNALRQQNLQNDAQGDDFAKIKPAQIVLPPDSVIFDKAKWENNLHELSSIFKKYPSISASSVCISFISGTLYNCTSEGTKLRIPINMACLAVNANAQAEDGEYLRDQYLAYAFKPDDLPTKDKLSEEITTLATNLSKLSKAKPIDEAYNGPVIFEGEALAEVFAQKLFGPRGLYTNREPVNAVDGLGRGGVNKFDNKLNLRIAARNLNIFDTPALQNFNNLKLTGNYAVDADGLNPADTLKLVEKGILKTLLTDRIPTSKIKMPNGHNRISYYGGTSKAPGIVNIDWENGKPADEFRRDALRSAADDGLDYIYAVRKLDVFNFGTNRVASPNSSNLPISRPLYVYRINVKTGEEELIRTAVISDFSVNLFKYISSATSDRAAYNLTKSYIPTSYILPKAMLFNDVTIEKDLATKPKLPLVENPVAENFTKVPKP